MHDKNWLNLFEKVIKISIKETGNYLTEKNYDMLMSRLYKRFLTLKISSPEEYIKYLEKNYETEKKHIISLITTHHTAFFREFFHFEEFEKTLLSEIISKKKDKIIKIWSAACSLGQEAYSLSMFFNRLKNEGKLNDFSYKIYASDVDEKSIKFAKNGVYTYKEIEKIPNIYIKGNWRRGTGEISNFVIPKKHITEKISFNVQNLLDIKFSSEKYDIIFCRNVFIYFNKTQIKTIVNSLLERLEPHGFLILGISESISDLDLSVRQVYNTIYAHKELHISSPLTVSDETKLIRVFCVDDSPTILTLLKAILKKEDGFEVVETAKSVSEINTKIKNLEFDIMTLDIHMPEETGIDYLKKYYNKNNHKPVVILSSIERDGNSTASEALGLGASDYVEKPDLKNLKESAEEIQFKLKTVIKNYTPVPEYKRVSSVNTLNEKSSIINKHKVKLLIVDDSPTIRFQLKKMLENNDQIEIVGETGDPTEVESLVKRLKPDVMTLDMNMPGMNGVEVLRKINQTTNLPTIVVSALNMEEGSLVMDAFAEGAVDYFQKPSLDKITEERKTLIEKIILAKSANIQKLSRHIVRNRNLTSLDRDYIIAIGASTGGTEALRVVLQGLPDKIPPIFVVQHIPAFFSDALAQRLNNLCPFTVIEAVDNMVVDKNTVYIAPGDKQMTIVKNSAGALKIRINSSEKRNGQRPSVDVCFESLSLINHKKIIAAILTGMGNDGALGLKKLKDIGAMTIAQNKESCVVFGMPNEAIKLGGACFIEPIEKVSQKILELLESKK